MHLTPVSLQPMMDLYLPNNPSLEQKKLVDSAQGKKVGEKGSDP